MKHEPKSKRKVLLRIGPQRSSKKRNPMKIQQVGKPLAQQGWNTVGSERCLLEKQVGYGLFNVNSFAHSKILNRKKVVGKYCIMTQKK